MRNMPNGPERQQIIDRMNEIFRRDSPWIGGYHPKNFALFHSWLGNAKVNEISDNKLKYLKVDRNDGLAGNAFISGVARQPEAQGRMIPWLFTIVGLVEAMYFINLAFGFVFLGQVH